MLRSLAPLWRYLQLAYYRWALAEIDPMHPDVPLVVLHINRLEKL